jgi:hypothetical protein
MFTYRDGGKWHMSVVSSPTTSASYLSITIGDDGQPIVAFSNAEGLWLARGVDIVGQSEEQQQPTAVSLQPPASVIRNSLLLPGAPGHKPYATSWLLDAAGRKVLGLHSGVNDVSRLAPGVYFVREEEAQAVRKVVITR